MATYDDSDDDLGPLEASGIIQPAVGGRRQVSATSFNTVTSQQSSSSSSSSASASVKVIRPPASPSLSPEPFIEVPTHEDSIESLEEMGLERATATQLFQWYLGRDPNSPDGLIEYALGHIAPLQRVFLPEEFEVALRRLGFRREFRNAILDPAFAHVFGTRDLHYWTRETIKIRYWTICAHAAHLKECASQARARDRGNPGARTRLQPDSARAGSVQSGQAPSTTIRAGQLKFPSAHVVMGDPGLVLEDHVVVWTGKSPEEHRTAVIEDDGTVNLRTILSPPGGDFNGLIPALYCAYDARVAEDYRKYSARRCPNSASWLIRIQVPKSFIESCTREELWYSDSWREYVWLCRNEKDLPDSLKPLEDADLVVGHICSKDFRPVREIPRANLHEGLANSHLRMDGTSATQWVLTAKQAVALAPLVKGKMSVLVTQATGFPQ